MASRPVFLLQIVHTHDGVVARIPGGGKLEADLVDACTKEILALGVGFARTQKHVEADIREGIHNAIHKLKQQTLWIA